MPATRKLLDCFLARRGSQRWLGLALVCCLLPSSSWAHPISISSAIVEVFESRLEVELQIMLEDLVLYHGVVADGDMHYAAADLLAAAEKHRQFLSDFFTILDADGQRLTGRLLSEDHEQIVPQGVHQSELMQRGIGMTWQFDLPHDKPEFLTFLQNFGGASATLPAIMDLYVVRNDVFLESAQLFHGRPHTVHLGWQATPSGRRQTLTEIRARRKEEFQKRLGISSYTGLYSFLYITRFEVRHEILVPLLTLEQWVPIARRQPDFLEVDEQAAAQQAIEEFFQQHAPVSINDQPVRPRIERVSFFSLDINDFALNADPRRVSVYQARVGVILTYPSRQSPQSVTVSWDQFTEFAPFIDTVLLIGQEKPERFYFHPRSSIYHWQGALIGPRVEPLRADGPLTTRQAREQLLTGLLTNIYRAFDFREDEDVFDALATSVHGRLLRDTYLCVKRTLLLAEHGGELSHALQVRVSEILPDDKFPADFQATWQVTSTTEHWGHIHRRVTQYRARLGLVERDGWWKLDRFELLDQQQLQFDTSIRGYDTNR